MTNEKRLSSGEIIRRGSGSLAIGIAIWLIGGICSMAAANAVDNDIRDWHSTDYGAETRQANYVGAQTVIWTGLMFMLAFVVMGACFVQPGMLALLRDYDRFRL